MILRDAIWLRDMEELHITRVAEILGIHVEAAKSRLVRAHAEVKDRVERKLRSHQTA
jgi:DNA-directed RNA polymerase specialized sigma24 family protein